MSLNPEILKSISDLVSYNHSRQITFIKFLKAFVEAFH